MGEENVPKPIVTISGEPADIQGAKVLSILAGETNDVDKISASMRLAAEFRQAKEEKKKDHKKRK